MTIEKTELRLPSTLDWDAVPDRERRQAANAIFVSRRFTDEFTAAMQELRDGSKKGAEAMCLVVIGQKGVGKSAFLKRYAADNRRSSWRKAMWSRSRDRSSTYPSPLAPL